MKGFKAAGIIILLFIVSVIVYNQVSERTIETEIVINASPEAVWTILMDHPSYGEWNPFIKQIEGYTNEGNYLTITLQSGENDPMEFQPQVLVNNPNQEFRWIGKLGLTGVFDGEHYFILEEDEAGNTRFVHGENFSGFFSGIILYMIGEDTKGGFISMNEALKQRAENI